MQRFLKRFFIFIVGYHLIVTCVGYGILGGKYPQMWPLLRDILRFAFIIYNAIVQRKQIKKYLLQRRKLRIRTGILIVFAVGISYLKDKSLYDMFVGIKYGLLYLPIFLSATFIGYLRAQKKENHKETPQIERFFVWTKYFLIIILI